MSESDFCIGLVKWFNKDKGYGFISLPGGGLDVFVHANQLRKSGITKLADGDKVKFETSKGPKGAFAINISILESNPNAEYTPAG